MEKKIIELIEESTGVVYNGDVISKEEIDITDDEVKRIASHLVAGGAVVPVRCRHCAHHHWEQEPCHGKTEHYCSVLKAQVFADFYCYHGTPKE